MNDPTITLVNAMYDQRIENLRNQIRSEIAKYISSPSYDLFYKQMNELYIKQAEAINLERRSCINILSEQLYTQDFNSFMNIGNQMSQIKMYDKRKYDFLVDQAFAVNTSLSLFKFKYA